MYNLTIFDFLEEKPEKVVKKTKNVDFDFSDRKFVISTIIECEEYLACEPEDYEYIEELKKYLTGELVEDLEKIEFHNWLFWQERSNYLQHKIWEHERNGR